MNTLHTYCSSPISQIFCRVFWVLQPDFNWEKSRCEFVMFIAILAEIYEFSYLFLHATKGKTPYEMHIWQVWFQNILKVKFNYKFKTHGNPYSYWDWEIVKKMLEMKLGMGPIFAPKHIWRKIPVSNCCILV